MANGQTNPAKAQSSQATDQKCKTDKDGTEQSMLQKRLQATVQNSLHFPFMYVSSRFGYTLTKFSKTREMKKSQLVPQDPSFGRSKRDSSCSCTWHENTDQHWQGCTLWTWHENTDLPSSS
jgi:hypothetical protein